MKIDRRTFIFLGSATAACLALPLRQAKTTDVTISHPSLDSTGWEIGWQVGGWEIGKTETPVLENKIYIPTVFS